MTSTSPLDDEPDRDPTSAPLVVVMGVSGSGKSTVGAALAQRLGVPFADGDDLHPARNIAKMAAGVALDDDDRRPWLDAVGRWLADREGAGGVIACSALKRAYRDQLRDHAPQTTFLHLDGSHDVIARRQAHRAGHFMPAALLASQEQTLERLEPDERGVAIAVEHPVEQIVQQYLDRC